MTKKRALVAIPLVVLLGAAAAVFVIGARGGGMNAADNKASDASGSMAEPAVAGDERAGALTDTSARQTRRASGAAPVSRAVISTGQVTLRSNEMVRARSEIMRLVAAWGGSVADEQSTSDDKGRLVESTMTLRVPSSRFDDAMSAFDALGNVKHRSRTSEDVTTKVIDNDARVRAAERSIRQLERLLSRAEELGDIIAIENDLARRQADLDSLKSQQAWLADQTSLSTVTVYLSRPSGKQDSDESKGFLAGLENGWHALVASTVVALTVVGAVLPFAVLLALVGVPVWLLLRRRGVATPPVAEA